MPKLPKPVPTIGKSRTIGRLSVQRSLVDSQEIGATGGWPPTTLGQAATSVAPRPSDASSRTVRPIDDQRDPAARGSPTTASPTTNGRQNHGPAIRPTRNALDDEHDHQQDDQTPLPRVAQPGRQALAAAARGNQWSTIARASGKASEPSARNAPAPPIMVPNKNGCSGTSAIHLQECRRRVRRGAGVVQPAQERAVDGVSSRSSSDGAQIGARPG